MNNKHLVSIFFLAAFFTSCDPDDQPTEKLELFGIEVSSDYINPNDIQYVVVHDIEGTLLDEVHLENGQEYKLTGAFVPDKLDITLLTLDPISKQFRLNTFRSVSTGGTWKLRRPDSPGIPSPVGSATFEIRNLESFESPSVAVRIETGTGNGAATNVTFQNNIYRGTKELFSTSSKVFVTALRNGDRVYKTLENVAPDDNIVLDVNDFVEFDSSFPVNPLLDGMVTQGFKGDKIYTLSSFDQFNEMNPPTLGYINGFDRYYSLVATIQNHTDNAIHVTREKLGDPIPDAEFPQYYTIYGESEITQFALQNMPTVTMQEAKFSYEGDYDITWTVVSNGLINPQAKSVPPRLKESIPDLLLSQLGCYGASFRQYLSGETYEEIIERQFDGVEQLLDYDFYHVEIDR